MSDGVTSSSSTINAGTRGLFGASIERLRRAFGPERPRWRRIAAMSVALGIGAFAWFLSLPAMRVGDGMEYYAMFYAWKDGLRPWMTPEGFQSYQVLYESGTISGMLPAPVLQEAFPSLRLGETADFNHFWFYSLLAAIPSVVAGVFGIELGPHSSFMLLHAMLLGGTVAVCGAMHGWRGVAVVVIILMTSPLIWFVNKVHVEFFSVCLTMSSVALLSRGRFVFSALAMAAAGTQNPGLLLPALVILGLRVVIERQKPFSLIEVSAVVATVGLIAIHPFYYLARYNTITTQLLAGGAKPGVALNVFYIWLVDPDLGLLPNWLFGIFFLIFGAAQWRLRAAARSLKGAIDSNLALWIGLAFFLVAAFYSHSSTVNLNSGGSPGIARYSLWYLAPLYPFVLLTIDAASHSRVLTSGVLAAAVGSSGMVMVRNAPHLPENAASPSDLSYFVQRYLPFAYTPPPEVFRERFGAQGEAPGLGAIVGPDCRKVLIIGKTAPEQGNKLFVPGHCEFRPAQVAEWIESNRSDLSAFHRLELSDIEAPYVVALSQEITFTSEDSNAGSMLAEGWSSPEPWGVWSEGTKSIVVIHLPEASPKQVSLTIVLNGFTPPASPVRRVSITANAAKPVEMVFDQNQAQRVITFPVDVLGDDRSSVIRVAFEIENPISPSDAGLSGDGRQLGIGLVSVSVEPEATP